MIRLSKILACAAAVSVVVGAGLLVWRNQAECRRTVLTDGQSIREPLEEAPVRQVLWQPPHALTDAINTRQQEYEPRFSADGLTMYFVRGKAGANADIWTATRADPNSDGWSEAQPLPDVNTLADELGPEPSPDGRSLYFCSNRVGGIGGYDLWMSRRDGAAWQPPVNLGPAVNSTTDEYGPAVAPDSKSLCFSSNRARPGEQLPAASSEWGATLRENRHRHDFDLYVSTRDGDAFPNAAPIRSLNTPANEGAAVFSPLGDFLYFASDRPGGSGGFDLFRTRCLNGDFQVPENLGPGVNTAANELDPALSMGGFAMCFSSDRDARGGGERDYDLFATQSREVFLVIEPGGLLGEIEDLWIALRPLLPWLLLGVLLLFTLLALVRSIRSGRLSLLARCLLASLAVHVLLMILFTFWQVTTGIIDMVHDGGGTKVIMASGAGSDALITQVRGNLTDIAVAPSQLPAARFGGASVVESSALRRITSDVPLVDLPMPPASSTVSAEDAPMSASEPAPGPDAAMVLARREVYDVRTPATAAVQGSQEASLRAAPRDAPLVGRADSTRVAAPPVAMRIDSTPQLSDLGGGSASSQVAAVVSAADSATPALPTVIESKVDLPAAASLVAGDVRIPAAVVVAASSPSGEHSLQVRAVSGSAAKREGVVAPPTQAPHLQRVQVPPQVGGDSVTLPPSLLGAAVMEMPDAVPMPPAQGANAGISIRLPQLPSADVAVAVPSAMGDGKSDGVESQLHVAAAPAAGATRASAHESATSAAGSSMTHRFDPASTDTSISAISGAYAGDQVPADVNAPTASNTVGQSVSMEVASLSAPHGESPDVHVPTEIAPPVDQYQQRAEDIRKDMVKRMGGSEATERAVALALQWLAAHQSADGRWAARGFDEDCGACGGAAKYDTDVAATSLALLCFMASDHTHHKAGPYQNHVRRGMKWLLAQQKPDGDLRGNETMYSHGIASIALAEAWGMTHDESLRQPVSKAVQFILDARNTAGGGWRYEPGQFGDTSVMGWQIMALTSAQHTGIAVPDEAFAAAGRWLDLVSSPAQPGLYAYQPGQKPSASMTAEGMFVRQLLGENRQAARMTQSAGHVIQNLPRWNREPNTYYWYYATLALFQHQGPEWASWNKTLTSQLLANQRTSGSAAGSWDPVDGWSKIGGRVYQTAICTLSLEVYYRYLPMYAANPAANRDANAPHP